MSNILAYPAIPEVSEADLLIISDISEDGNPTRTVSVQALVGGSTAPLGLTVNGTSGAATLIDNILNIPIYTGGGGGTVTNVTYSTNINAFAAGVTNSSSSPDITLTLNGGSVGQFLRQDGEWATVPGGNIGTVTSVDATINGNAYIATVATPTAAADITIAPQGDATQYINGLGNLVLLSTLPGGSGVTQIIGGTNVTVSPASGTGTVTVNSTDQFIGTVTGVTGTLPITSSGGTTPAIGINNYTGADGTTAGTNGAVPAPAATDNVKFLKGDGTWAVPAGGGGAGSVTNVSASTAGDALDVAVTNATTTPDLAFTWAGTNNQYINGAGDLATLPATATTYNLDADQDGLNVDLRLTPSTGSADIVQFTAGSGITLTETGNNNITIAASGSGGLTSVGASSNYLTIANSPLTSNGVIQVNMPANGVPVGTYTNATVTVDQYGFVTNASSGSTIPSNIVETVTTTDGQFIDLTPNSPTSGAVAVTADLSATGTPSSTTFLRGDNTWATVPGGGGLVTSLTTTGTSGASTLISGVLNVPNYADNNTEYTLTTTGASGDIATLVGTVINVPTPVIPYTSLTTTGTSGASTLVGGVLNIPNYTAGGVISVDKTTPGTSTGNPIIVNPTTGNVLVQSMAYAGTTNIGHVPTGGDNTKFLRGDGTWVVPSGGTGTVTNVAYTTDISAFTANVTNPTGSPIITLNLNGGTAGQFLQQDGQWATPAGGTGTVTSITPVATTGTGTAITTIGDITFTGAGGIATSVNAANEVTITSTGGGSGGFVPIGTLANSDIYNANWNNTGTTARSVVIGNNQMSTDALAALEVHGRTSVVDPYSRKNTFVGFESGKDYIGGGAGGNTGFGYQTLTVNTDGQTNSAFGRSALGANTTGDGNTAVGYLSMISNTTGQFNTALGQASMNTNSTGSFNTCIGAATMNYLDGFDNNVAVGYRALIVARRDNNTAVGTDSGGEVVYGKDNVFLGYQAGNWVAGSGAVTDGNENVFIGARSGLNNAIDDRPYQGSIYIGYESAQYASPPAGTVVTNETVIGHKAVGKGTNTVVLGNDDVTETYLKGVIVLEGYTYAQLIALTAVIGMKTYITDGGTPTYGTNASGGGSTKIPVFYNGSNWIYA